MVWLPLASGPLSPDIDSEDGRNESALLQDCTVVAIATPHRADLHPVATLGLSLPLWAAKGKWVSFLQS